MTQCKTRDKPYPLPPGLTIETAKVHPRYVSYLEPGGQCVLEEGHEGPHRARTDGAGLVWYDPQIVQIGE